MALTLKQQAFVDEYLKDRNATQAAIRCGYSEKTAKQQGSRLLSNVDVASAIDSATTEVSERAKVDAQDVLESILRIRAKAEDADRHSDALKANELLGKHLKMFTDRQEVSAPDGGPVSIIERVIVDKGTDPDS